MNNPPAFPIHWENHSEGMTLRDYFAAKAMQSMIGRKDYIDTPEDVIARIAYKMANAMLKAREA